MEKKISWPGWEVVEPIGRGAFGSVYKIHREVADDEEYAALKVISIPKDDAEVEYMIAEGQDKDSITQSFRDQMKDIVREYKIMRGMRDVPNIVHCDDVRCVQRDSDYGWDIYIQMELLTPLLKCLEKVACEEEIVRLTEDLCSALVACQHQNIIHRDIKPQNIFVSSSGMYKLGDFGIARSAEHTTSMSLAGTYPYMAPEVATGKYDKTVDIYSLGLVLYWLLNEGRGPFVPEKATYQQRKEAQDRRFAGEPLPMPKYGSEGLKRIVLKACAFNPKDRYSSAKHMLDAVQALKKGELEETQQEKSAEDRETVWIPEQETETAANEQSVRQYKAGKTVRNKPQKEKKTRAKKRSAREQKNSGVAVGIALIVIVGLLVVLAVVVYRGYAQIRASVESSALDSVICVAWNKITGKANGHPIGSTGICEDCGINAFSVNTKGTLYCMEENVDLRGHLVIPDEIDGKPVREIGEKTFAQMTEISSVVLPESLISIANHAFDGCTNLSKVYFPQNLVAIGSGAFAKCTALQDVHVPTSVICVGTNAFPDCNVSIAKSTFWIGAGEPTCKYTVREETIGEVVFWTEADAAEIVVDESDWRPEEKWYNSQGALIKSVRHYYEGTPYGWGCNAYEQFVSDEEYARKVAADKTEYYYNTNGELAGLRIYYSDGTVYEYAYLVNGNVVRITRKTGTQEEPEVAYYNDIYYLGINFAAGTNGKVLSYDYY